MAASSRPSSRPRRRRAGRASDSPPSRTPRPGAPSTSSSPTDSASAPTSSCSVSASVPRPRSRRTPGSSCRRGGAVVVTPSQLTSDPHIWAVGDAIQVADQVTGVAGVVPLAGPANRQGRVAADAIMGARVRSRPVLGTAIVRVFGLTAAVTGPTSRRSTAAGVEHRTVHLHPGNHAGLLPRCRADAPRGRLRARRPPPRRAGRRRRRRGQAHRRDRDRAARPDDHRRPRRARAGVRAALRERQGPGQHGGVHGTERARRHAHHVVRRRTSTPSSTDRPSSSTSAGEASSSWATCPAR